MGRATPAYTAFATAVATGVSLFEDIDEEAPPWAGNGRHSETTYGA